MSATDEQQLATDLVCIHCQGALQREAGRGEGRNRQTLVCSGCGETFAVVGGIPRFVTGLGSMEKTAESYGYQWTGFWKGLFDRGDVFGLQFEQTAHYFLSSLGLHQTDTTGMTVLDAGTGSGRIPLSIHHMVQRVYAVDMHSGLDSVSERLAHATNVSVVQANLLKLPFRDRTFDIAWSSGVLMYSPDAGETFAAVARKVKPGGRMFVSVYGKDVNHYRMFRHLLPWAHKLPTPLVYAMSALIALPLYLGFNLMLWHVRTFRKDPPPHRVAIFTVEDSSPKSYKSILLNLFDQLHPDSQSEHSVEEVIGWFSANGFADTVVTEHIGMVAVRGVKQAQP